MKFIINKLIQFPLFILALALLTTALAIAPPRLVLQSTYIILGIFSDVISAASIASLKWSRGEK